MAETPEHPAPRWLDDDEQEAWRVLLRHQVRALDRLDSELSEQFGLSLADYEILVHLSEAPDRQLRMSELADHALVSRSRLTHRIDRLVDAGLVVRRRCPSDRRGVNAVLTAEGVSLLERAAPSHVASVRRYVIDPLRPTTRRALVDDLRPVLDELEREQLASGCPEAS